MHSHVSNFLVKFQSKFFRQIQNSSLALLVYINKVWLDHLGHPGLLHLVQEGLDLVIHVLLAGTELQQGVLG